MIIIIFTKAFRINCVVFTEIFVTENIKWVLLLCMKALLEKHDKPQTHFIEKSSFQISKKSVKSIFHLYNASVLLTDVVTYMLTTTSLKYENKN